MGTKKRIERFLGLTPMVRGHECGQILVLVAISMIGLLVAAGLAVDVGFLLMRKSQLDRAMDSSVLSGATLLSTGTIAEANTRGLQFLAANGIVIPSARSGNCVNGGLPDNLDYCGEQLPGAMPGALRYRAIVRWNVPTFFMPLIQFNNVPLTADATAEYYSMVDIYASEEAGPGLLKTATLSLFGPEICTGFGDPYTPDSRTTSTLNPWYNDLNGAYTFRIAISPDYLDHYKTVRVEIFDPSSANSNAKFNVVGENQYRVWNATTSAVSTQGCSGTSQKSTCSIAVAGDTLNPWWFVRTDENRGTASGGHWGGCDEPDNYTPARNTNTLFRLYYYRQTNAGQFEEVDLAYYKSGTDAASDPKQNDAINTDNMWVAPGASGGELNQVYTDIFALTDGSSSSPLNSPAEPSVTVENCETMRASTVTIHNRTPAPVSHAIECSTPNESGTRLGNFIINLEDFGGQLQETPNIYVDPTSGIRYIYLQVRGLSGASENGFQIWAGPSNLEEPMSRAPSEVNARHVYIQRMLAKASPEEYHFSQGLYVVGMGHLPMNHNANNRVEMPLAYLGPEYAGQKVTIRLFDPDSGSKSPIYFYSQNMPKYDWTACFASGADDDTQCETASGNSSTPVLGGAQLPNGDAWSIYTFMLPSQTFVKGRLIVSYEAQQDDTFGWYITVEARPTLVG